MPYYSELGIYTTPSSTYSTLSGPYSKHSSILASNYGYGLKTTVPRNFRGYKPHLATITESNSTNLRRINSPTKLLLRSSPKARVPKPIKINTADIDVSYNKYKKSYDDKVSQDRASPKPEETRSSTEEKEAKPNTIIRRERATVRLHTVHKDKLPKSWRDNFEPHELSTTEKIQKKSPGEILKEKFLIRSRSKENIKDFARKSIKKNLPKSPSFKDICTAITTESIDDELNPGQPEEVQRRQSRQFSTEDILKEIRRSSSEISQGEIMLLDQMINEALAVQEQEERKKKKKVNCSVKKKVKKRNDETLVVEDGQERSKSPIQRRPTVKGKSPDIVRDISQVEIEEIPVSPKKKITGSVDVEEVPISPTLKVEVEIEDAIVVAPKKALKFNVIVEEIEDERRSRSETPEAKPKRISRKIKKRVLMEVEDGKLTVSKIKPIISNVLVKKEKALVGKEMRFLELPKPKEEEIKSETEPHLKTKGILKKSEEGVSKEDSDVVQEAKAELEEPDNIEEKEEGEEKDEDSEEIKKKIISKRSLIVKANKEDPDLEVFEPPEEEPKVEEQQKEEPGKFVPLQSNRLSQWMHPWKKPEQFDECPIEIYARPKVIKGRHYPRPRHPPPVVESSSEDSDDSDTSSDDEENAGYNKVGASTSSNDSGFDSEVHRSRNKDCDVNCHKKCEKLTANLCGVNQKLIVEAIESVKRDSLESRESPLTPHAHNPELALDSEPPLEDYTKSSTFVGFQKSGRITPPATTIPRFRKYCLEDFNFLKVLGKGSFGKVLLAELKNTDYYYAIKCLKKDVVLEDDDVECTLIERKVLALGTKHPYLCHLLCTFQTESHLFFVMEYLNGGDLMFHIQKSGRFSEDRARFYGAEIVSGLRFLHNKGIVYRDLKLDNILLDFDGHVRIADFGMCKLQVFLDRMADTFCGTPDYMAPEIIKGQHYNQCVDWWSFGVLLYEMLIGQSPFSGCDEDELFWSICNEKPVLPRFLSAESTSILSKLLEKDFNKRLGNRFSPHGTIQEQPFFKSIDWTELEARRLEPPFKPSLLHPLDTQYFDSTFTKERAKLTPIEQTILQSMDQTQFLGFSYTNPNATDK